MNLTKKQKQKWIIENCMTRDGTIDLKGLSFKCDVDISNMKVKGILKQHCQTVKGDLWQDNCEIKNGDLYQDHQKVINGTLWQDMQKVIDGELYQGFQTIKKFKDTLCLNNQTIEEVNNNENK